MAKYTFTLREMVEDYYGRETVEGWFKDYDLSDYLTADELQVVEETGIYSKDRIASMIVDHYYMYESGLETPGLFIRKARIKMREVMDKYAKIIYAYSLKIEPLVNVDYTETYTATSENNGNASGSSKNSGLSLNNDTPQGKVEKADLLNGKYTSSSNASEGEGSSSSTSHDTGTSEYSKRIRGNSGVSATAQTLIKQYRDIIEPINLDIIEEVEDLFMSVY